MAKIHWAATEKTPACNRSRTNWRTVSCPAGEYLAAEQSDPERYCCRCAKLCKLSIRGTRSVCFVNTRSDSDRYAELRRLVEDCQREAMDLASPVVMFENALRLVLDWRHQ